MARSTDHSFFGLLLVFSAMYGVMESYLADPSQTVTFFSAMALARLGFIAPEKK